MKAIKRNMVSQLGQLFSERQVLHCLECDSIFSGNAGDYWQYPDDHEFKFANCDGEMELVRKVVSIQYV